MVSFLTEPSLYFDETIQPLFFLKPSNPAEGPTCDTVADGILVLKIPKAREVKEITVELTGKQTMWIKGRHEAYVTLSRCITLTPGWLQEGEHRFEYSFVIPANTAPYEACMFGRTSHHVKATAKGLARFGKDLVASSEIDTVADPNETSIANGLNWVREIFNSTLGPLRARFFTKYLLRGGLLRFALSMPVMAQPVIIDDVKVILAQNFNLQSMKNPELVEHIETLIPLWSSKKEGVTPLKIKDGQELCFVRQLRLMAEDNHEMLRPTSNDWSETGIRIAHQLVVLIRFKPLENNPEGLVKELKIAFDGKISSCASNIENHQLPEYDAQRPHFNKAKMTVHSWRLECLCHRPTSAELEAVYGSDLKADKEDHYGNETNTKPAWLAKLEESDGHI